MAYPHASMPLAGKILYCFSTCHMEICANPSMIRVCRITKGLPTLSTPDEPNSLRPPSASAFSHPSNIRVKSISLPFHLYRSFSRFKNYYYYFEFIFVLFQRIFCHKHLCSCALLLTFIWYIFVYLHNPNNMHF